MTPEVKAFIEAWLKKAEGDIITAQCSGNKTNDIMNRHQKYHLATNKNPSKSWFGGAHHDTIYLAFK